jgi:hypothetical protein
VCIVEICSAKKYVHNNFYLHHLSVDKRFGYTSGTPSEILEGHTIEKQSDDEIENDILEIRKMLFPKKIVIVSHYNSKQKNEYIKARNDLILLLDRLCQKHDIPFINPTVALSMFTQEEVMTDDLGHYTNLGYIEIAKCINLYVKSFAV